MRTMWIAGVAVAAVLVAGCRDGSEEKRQAGPGPEAAPAAEARYEGRTAAEWVRTVQSVKPDSPGWAAAADQARAALVRIGAEAIPALMEGMKDKQAHVREFCIFALGQYGDAAVGTIPALIAAAQDESFLVVEAADSALGSLCLTSQKALDRMIELLSDPAPLVRKTCAEQMEALGARAKPALPALEKLATDSDKDVREAAESAIAAVRAAM